MPDIESSVLNVPADLADAGTYVRNVSAELARELDTLQKKLLPLEEGWTGEAREYFVPLEQEWNLASTALWGDGSSVGLLPFIAHALDVGAANYANAEASNKQTWRR